jgi:hypothetical protein
MDFSFKLDEFLALLQNYNLAIWPLQVAAYALGIAALLLAALKTKYSGRIISGILAFFWLWTGGVFNLVYFRPFYPLAIVFVFLFIAQGIIFAIAAAGPKGPCKGAKPHLSFGFQHNARTLTAKLLALYALVGYPLLEIAWGRGFPRTLPFGLVPCPTTLFTLAILLLADRKLPWPVFAIPLCYSFAGIVPLANGIHEDIGLVAGGVLALYFLACKREKGGSA